MASADYIVVGAGSAGCVVARRLVDAGFTVALLEAGPPDHALDFRIHMPAALSEVLGSTTYNWAFHSAPEVVMNGRRMYCPRGKTLGGSSAINGMIFVRGHAADFDRWAQQSGFPQWDYAHCLPFFKRSESVPHGDSAWRGRDGPMRVSRGDMTNPLFDAFLQAGREAGHHLSTDLNGEHQEGVGPFDRTIFAGRRWSAARGYLDPIRDDQRLSIRTGTTVRRILPDATEPGVEIDCGGDVQTLRAGSEVIVCAGAIGSPQLLMLSGIGDANALREAGVDSSVHLPGVGSNLQDHLEVYLQHACRQPVSLYPALKPWNKAWIGPLWYLTHRGPAASNHFEAGGFLRSGYDAGYPDLQLHFLPVAMNYDGTGHAGGHGYQVHVGPMKPTSRGQVDLVSPDPRVAPRIAFNYASTTEDRQVMRAGIARVRDIMGRPAFDRFRGEELAPGAAAVDDDALDAFVAIHGESAYHPCGTCRMGRGDDAVVDAEGRVYGTDNLRVIDASVMPEITNGNLNAPVLMLAEKMVSAIVERSSRSDSG